MSLIYLVEVTAPSERITFLGFHVHAPIQLLSLAYKALNVPKHALDSLCLLRLLQNGLRLEIVEPECDTLAHLLDLVSLGLQA